MMLKNNCIQIRLSDAEVRTLNDGWFEAVKVLGRPMTKSEYIRFCFDYVLKELERKGAENE